MNNIIYNISLILLSLGFILMVIYITIILTKNTRSCIYNNNNNNNNNKSSISTISSNIIYDDRPSLTYVKMFNQPSIGLGYQDFDANDNITSFYTKTNN